MKREDAKTQRRKIQFLLLMIALFSLSCRPLDRAYQAEEIARELPDEAETIEVGNAQENMALKTHYARFQVSGTQVGVRWQGLAEFIVFEKGTTIRELPVENNWQNAIVEPSRFQQGSFSFAMRSTNATILIDTLIVSGDTSSRLPLPSWFLGCIIPFVLIVVWIVKLAMKTELSNKQDAI